MSSLNKVQIIGRLGKDPEVRYAPSDHALTTDKRTRRPSTLNHLSAALMMRALMDGPSSVPEIAYETGISYVTVRRYVRALRDRRVIHIAAWDVDARGRRTLAAYSFGDRHDAPRPPRATAAQRQAAHRERARHMGLMTYSIASRSEQLA